MILPRQFSGKRMRGAGGGGRAHPAFVGEASSTRYRAHSARGESFRTTTGYPDSTNSKEVYALFHVLRQYFREAPGGSFLRRAHVSIDLDNQSVVGVF